MILVGVIGVVEDALGRRHWATEPACHCVYDSRRTPLMTELRPPPADDPDSLSLLGPARIPAPIEEGWTTLGTGERVQLASTRARFKARAFDSAVMWVGCFILAIIVGGSSPTGSLVNP